jgi:hypothetical protein
MRGSLLGRDYTTVGQDGEFAARDWVKSALPDNAQNEESASNGRKITEKNGSSAHTVRQYSRRVIGYPSDA